MERAVELDPLSAVHRMNLANYYGLLGMPERSRGQLEKAMEVAPDWHMPFTVAAYDAYFAGQFDVAARHGGHAATVEGPEARLAHSAAWLTANAWLSLGEFSTARQWLAYALDSGKPQWWIDQAEIRIRLAEGRDADAHALLESWVAGIPTDKDCCLWHRMIQSNADAWGYAALIELMLGHPEHAQADYARAEAVAADATDAGSPPWDARDWPFADNDLLQWGYLPANQWAWLRRRANREEAAGRLLDESFAFLDSLADERPAGPGEAYVAACAHALRGEQRQALALLDHAVEAGWARPLLFARDPCLDSLRRRTEFIAIADRIDRSLLAQRDALADTPALVQAPVSR
jgi:tetratricopeptide (TPR) repeat protein